MCQPVYGSSSELLSLLVSWAPISYKTCVNLTIYALIFLKNSWSDTSLYARRTSLTIPCRNIPATFFSSTLPVAKFNSFDK